ncbi:UDP-galactopyranose mutase [Carpediemonas membranifera]|uniref:UDP-galactopyranose mutase n=1 Tax=Carpediemonas membranifera TaxID=201153 RepID=A0A8J6AV10_9EUKA|nr:UDP-galactopyranose mutase [Carpediemonas membranifera]|eukprot:KAG9393200.1 UDP-galactopyranose mutase [Carpediemonas membranifera]
MADAALIDLIRLYIATKRFIRQKPVQATFACALVLCFTAGTILFTLFSLLRAPYAAIVPMEPNVVENKYPIMIVGSGPTGLGAAHRLRELGLRNYRVLEMSDVDGGLARSRQDNKGFWWDFGGHVLFSHYEYFDNVVDSVLEHDQERHERQAWVVMDKETEVPYPFQNNIHRLTKAEQTRIFDGLEAIQGQALPKPANFREWIYQSFGEGLAEIFLIPYNYKVWAHPAEEMGTAWMGERVARVNVTELRQRVAENKDAPSWGPNNMFLYPSVGGVGEIFRRVGEDLSGVIEHGTRIVGVDPERHSVTTTNAAGRTRTAHYSKLITTMPLDELLRLVAAAETTSDDDSKRFSAAADALSFSTTHVIGIGVKGALPDKFVNRCWYYFPTDDAPFYRITVLSNYAPEIAPTGHYSLMAEVAESSHRPVSDATIVNDVIQGMRNVGFLEPSSEIVSRFHWTEKHGYPTPSVDRDAILADVQPWLMEHDIFSRGRFGGWKYEVGNMDHSFMQGVEAADAALAGVPETTYFNADFVNNISKGKNARRPSLYSPPPGRMTPVSSNVPATITPLDSGPKRGPKRGLVAIPAGKGGKEAIAAIVESFGHEDFDYVFFRYDRSEWSEYQWASDVLWVDIKKQGKWWFPSRIITPAVADAYDYILFWDDDGGIDVPSLKKPFNVTQAMEIMERHRVWAAQPSLSEHEGHWRPVTATQSGTGDGRMTTFIEVMLPIYSRAYYNRVVYPTLQFDATVGWGYDFIFAREAYRRGLGRMAVLDATPAAHLDRKSQQGTTKNNRAHAAFLDRSNIEMFELIKRTLPSIREVDNDRNAMAIKRRFFDVPRTVSTLAAAPEAGNTPVSMNEWELTFNGEQNAPIMIVGSGPTGLGAAHRLRELGLRNYRVLEMSDVDGGLARSRQDNKGFWWDFGGHVLFSHYEYFDNVVDSVLEHDQERHERQAWVVMDKETEVPYPFQNNIHRLTKAEQTRIFDGLEAIQGQALPKPANFREWIYQSFGEGLAEIFLIPYNYKVWAHPAEEMGTAWMGERVARVNVTELRQRVAENKDAPSWGPNNMFLYPSVGGVGEIFRRVGEDLSGVIEHGTRIVGVDPERHSVTTTNAAGRTRTAHYSKLITTMPLDELLRLVAAAETTSDDDSKRFSAAADALSFSTTHVIGIGVKGALPDKFVNRCWYYFPTDDAPFYRITVLSNYAPEIAPTGHYSLMAEVAESSHRPVSDATIVNDVIQGMRNVGFLEPSSEIVSRFHWTEKHGYPTPSVDRDAILADVQPWLMEHDIFSRGRFGGWKYEVGNMDHSFMQGVEAADAALAGVPETTYFNADFVNNISKGKNARRPNLYLPGAKHPGLLLSGTQGHTGAVRQGEKGNMHRVMNDGDFAYFQGPRTQPLAGLETMYIIDAANLTMTDLRVFCEAVDLEANDVAVVGRDIPRELFITPLSDRVIFFSAPRGLPWLISRLVHAETLEAYRTVAVIDTSLGPDPTAWVPMVVAATGHGNTVLQTPAGPRGPLVNTVFDRDSFVKTVLPVLVEEETEVVANKMLLAVSHDGQLRL